MKKCPLTTPIEVDQKTESEIMAAALELRDRCGISERTKCFDICSMLDVLKGISSLNFDYEICPDKDFPPTVEACCVGGIIYLRESIWNAAAWRPPKRLWDVEASANYFKYAQRARFTIAHELGHFVLHSEKKYLTRKRQMPKDDSRCSELQANLFAAHLLISLPALHEIDRNGWLHADYISNKFRVSKSCAIRTIRHYSDKFK